MGAVRCAETLKPSEKEETFKSFLKVGYIETSVFQIDLLHIPHETCPFSLTRNAGRSGDAVTETRGKSFFPRPFCFDLQPVRFLSPGKFQILLKMPFF